MLHFFTLVVKFFVKFIKKKEKKAMENLFYISTVRIPSTVQVKETFSTFQFTGPLGSLEYRKSQIDSLGLAFTFLEAESLQIFVKKTYKKFKISFRISSNFLYENFSWCQSRIFSFFRISWCRISCFFEHQKTEESKSDTSSDNSDPKSFEFHHLDKISSLVEFKIGQSHQIHFFCSSKSSSISILNLRFYLFMDLIIIN
jgi:hypothetical protein